MNDYYKILNLDKNFTEDEIKKSYRKLVLEYHPDKNPGDLKSEQNFKKIVEAYEILSDPNKKRNYDILYNIQHAPHYYDTSTKWSTHFDNTYGQFFKDEKAPNFFINLKITLEEAFYGAKKKIGIDSINIEDIQIPIGVQNGHTIKIRGKGQKGWNPELNGDLIININIMQHPIFVRQGHDLVTEAEISLPTALVGGFFYIDVFNEKLKITVKPMQYNKKIRIKEKGMMTSLGLRGDLYIDLKVKLPETLTEEESNFFIKMKEKYAN